MKRYILLITAICLSCLSFAQKAPKKTFSTDSPLSAYDGWESGDLISLPEGDDSLGVVYTAEKADDKTGFWGRGACRTEEGNWAALYPASALRKWDEKTLYFTIPHEQTAVKADRPMYSRTQTPSLEFKPLTSYLKFTLSASFAPVKEIRFVANKYISGSYKADMDAKNVSVLLDVGDRFREIVLKPQDGGVIAPGDYVMSIFARVLPDGLTVEVETVDGKVAAEKINRELRFTIGKERDLGVIKNLKFANESNSQLGSAYNNDGVLFWLNPDDPSKGKVVAASADIVKWAESNDLYGIHTFKDNYEKVHSTVTGLYAYATEPENFKAVRTCEEMRKSKGGNWHVPSAREMRFLFNAYYGNHGMPEPENGTEYADRQSQEAAARFDAHLVNLGGEKMLARGDQYWICGQNSNGNMQYVRMGKYLNAHDLQTAEKYVRCVRDVYGLNEAASADYPQTEVGKILRSELVPSIVDVVWDTTYTVADGLQYHQMTVVTDQYEKMDVFLLKADPSKDVDVRVAWSNECTPTTWVRQTPAQMAAHMDSPEKPVYAIVNADFCENRIPIRPRGPMHCDGKILANSYSIDPRFSQQALSYVGVTHDGKMVIGHNRDYPAAQNTLKECTGAGVILIEHSQIQGGYVVNDKGRDPRTALGFTSENIVWILAVDGRHKGTEGMTYLETAHLFHGLGCVSAVNLDGGGSTQMLVKDPQSGEINMCNWPSDPTNGLGGRERPRLNGWVIMKK